MSLGFIIAAGIQIKEFSDNQKVKTIIDFGNSLKRELNLASVVKEGYQRTIILPNKVDNSINYTIQNTNSTLIIGAEGYEYSAIIPKVQGELKKGTNSIKKINGSVIIENV
ncbi:MAG: hypothetical protein KAK00_10125 [Nanoarchaeota archaeon]|nr:hypothetical protein [Nanoarchaeota archaeon]